MVINKNLIIITIILISLVSFSGLNPIYAQFSAPQSLTQVNIGGVDNGLCLGALCNADILNVAKLTSPSESSDGEFSDDLILPEPTTPTEPSDDLILSDPTNTETSDNYTISLEFDAYFNGNDLNLQEKYLQAIPWFEKSITPNSSPALLPLSYEGIGSSMLGLGRYQEAIPYLDRALDLMLDWDPNGQSPFFASILINKGLSLYELGRYEEALNYYDRASKADISPESFQSYYISLLNNKGAALSALGRNQEAIEQYDGVLAVNPYDVDALNNKGNALSSLGRYQEATEQYNKAIEALQNPSTDEETKIRPGSIQTDELSDYKELTNYVQFPTGDLNRADYIQVFDTTINLNKYNVPNGLKYITLSKDSEVLIVLQFNEGVNRYSAKNYEQANSYFDRVLKMNSNFLPGLYYKDLCLEKLGQPDKADVYEIKVKSMDPKETYKGEKLDTTLINVQVPIEQMFVSQ